MERFGMLRGGLPPPRRLRVLAARYFWLSFISLGASLIGHELGAISATLAAIWIANGVVIGFVLCVNPRRRNELLLIAFGVFYLSNRMSNQSPTWAFGLALSDLVQLFVATYLTRRMPVRAIDLTRVGLLMKVVVFSTLLGCASGVMALLVWVRFVMKTPLDPPVFISLFCSDAVGAAVTVPLYWYYRRKPKQEYTPIFRYQYPAVASFFAVVVAGIFWQPHYPIFLLALFPVLMPVIYMSGLRGAAWAILYTTVVGLLAAATGHGPMSMIYPSVQIRVVALQFYVSVALLTGLPFAAVMMERERLVAILRQSEARYRYIARLDGLTHLPNRREFDTFLDVSRQRSVRQNSPLSLLLVDIDHFKKLNDQHGHTVGDEYLCKVAAAVASAVPRKTDLAARYGGEEFGVILDSCDDAGAMMVAARIKDAVAALSRKQAATGMPAVTISIGIATTLPSLRSPSKVLIDAADAGLYTAKRNGRDRIERGLNLGALVELVP